MAAEDFKRIIGPSKCYLGRRNARAGLYRIWGEGTTYYLVKVVQQTSASP